MTAEIAIMNKMAVALAADSAVTIGQEEEQKTYNTVNKLFALSKYHPVGIMLYGRADFMGVPWEAIIKIYRSNLGERKFDTLQEYADDFIAFLDNGNPLFPESEQEDYLYSTTLSYFGVIEKAIKGMFQKIIKEEGEITYLEIERITAEAIKKHYDMWKKTEILPYLPKNHIEDILSKYGDIIDRVMKKVFKGLPLSNVSLNQLKKISASLFSKDRFPSNISGIVIAGFGEQDIFPSLKSFTVEAVVNNRLKYKEGPLLEIDFATPGRIAAFAQNEMGKTFMEGVDPSYRDSMEAYLSKVFDKYPEIIIESMSKIDDGEKQALKKKLKETSNSIFDDYKKEMEAYSESRHVNPIMNVVAALPRDELAAMAESLVNLTSFKRKVTMEAETVGGPIDVAVISKGDGFIWIKRKHYFKPELNPQFFANYYREEKDEKSREEKEGKE